MSADAIYQVTVALRSRLQQVITAAGGGSVFIGPLDDADAKGASLILFLYRVVPSATLRNREHRVPANNPPPPFIVYNNSLPLDLYYLVSVGTLVGGEEPALRWLGLAMRELNTNPEITSAALGQETVRVSLETLTTEEASRIWSLFPTANYRTSVTYLATPVWIDPEQPPASAARVVQDKLLGGQKAMEAEGV